MFLELERTEDMKQVFLASHIKSAASNHHAAFWQTAAGGAARSPSPPCTPTVISDRNMTFGFITKTTRPVVTYYQAVLSGFDEASTGVVSDEAAAGLSGAALSLWRLFFVCFWRTWRSRAARFRLPASSLHQHFSTFLRRFEEHQFSAAAPGSL